MLLLGFAGLGFAGYRKTRRIAISFGYSPATSTELEGPPTRRPFLRMPSMFGSLEVEVLCPA
jgi:hypothetical protein